MWWFRFFRAHLVHRIRATRSAVMVARLYLSMTEAEKWALTDFIADLRGVERIPHDHR